jgi:type I restriction enzyme, S subunit
MNDSKPVTGWRWVKVGEVLHETQYGLNLLAEPEGNMPIVGMKDLIDRRVRGTDLARVAISEIDATRYLLREGDILLNRTNSLDLVGKIGYVDRPLHAVFASYLVRLKANRSLVDPRFLAFWLFAAEGQEEIRPLITRGVSQANINPRSFCRRVAVPLPPLSEQRRIVEILATWDGALDRLDRQISCKRNLFIALRESLTGGELRRKQRHEPWPTTTLGQAAVLSFSSVDKKTLPGELAVKLCNYLDVFRNHRIDGRIQFSSGTASSSELEKFSLLQGDVVFTKDSETAEEIAEAAYVARTIPNLVCGYHLAIARPRKAVNGQYLYFALSSRRCRKQFVRNANGVTRFGLTLAGIQNIELPLPPADEQEAIAQLLGGGEREIAALEAEHAAMKKQRDALASELLTRRLRAREAERLAIAVG